MPPPNRFAIRGFTILELLSAITVLALLALVIFWLAESTSEVTKGAHLRMDADSSARQVLDRISVDLEQMILRPDLPGLFEKQETNDRITFFAMGDGYEGDRGISKVSYDVSDHKLRRGAEGKSWSGEDDKLVFEPDVVTPAAGENTETASDKVIRFETAFLMSDGSILAGLPAPGRILEPGFGGRSVRAIIIGVVTLDDRARNLIPNKDAAPLAVLFPDAEDNQTILAGWERVIGESGLPAPVLRGIRMYQRYFYLPETRVLAQH